MIVRQSKPGENKDRYTDIERYPDQRRVVSHRDECHFTERRYRNYQHEMKEQRTKPRRQCITDGREFVESYQ